MSFNLRPALLSLALISSSFCFSQVMPSSLLAVSPSAASAADGSADTVRPVANKSAIRSPTRALHPMVASALREADRHFQIGKNLSLEGNVVRARAEFDACIEALMDIPMDTPDRAIAERHAEEMVRQIHRYDIENLGSGKTAEGPVFVQSPLAEILDLTFTIDPSLKNPALATVKASSSRFPLVVNDAVLTYISFYTSPRGSKIFLNGLRRAGKYKDMISRILDEEGVPQELIHLAQAESGFIPRAVSRKAATGMWQFVLWRGNEYGLKQSGMHDDRLDPEKATRAAARHLRDLYNKFGDWYLAMAAYNCGPGCVSRAVERTGYVDFWEFRNRGVLPKETANYVPAIVAMAIMSKNLQAYGLQAPEPDNALDVDTVPVSADTSLALVADACDRPVSDVQDLNPAYYKGVAPSGVEIRVPRGCGNSAIAALDAVPDEKQRAWRLHRIGNGDTLDSISRHYAIPANSIVAANGSLGQRFFDSPQTGETLLIPASERSMPSMKPSFKSTKARLAKQTSRKSRGLVSAKTRSRAKASRPTMTAQARSAR